MDAKPSRDAEPFPPGTPGKRAEGRAEDRDAMGAGLLGALKAAASVLH